MKIVGIRQSRYHKDGFLIDLENGESIRVFRAIVAGFGLYEGRELSDGDVEAFRIAADCVDIEKKAVKIAADRPMSKRELAKLLMDEKVRREWAEGTAIRLETLGVISDQDFANMLAKHLSARNYGSEYIKAEFQLRGIDEVYWKMALESCPPPEAILEPEISKLLARSGHDVKNISRVTCEMLRRGFLIEDIKRVLAKWESRQA